MSEANNQEPASALGKHTRVTRRRKDGFMLEITWRGLVLVWDGRRAHWQGERGGNTWRLTTSSFEQFCFRSPGKDPSLDKQELETFDFSTARWMAYCGNGGDGAMRDRIEDALEASLEYAVRYNNRRISELRQLVEAE